MEILRKIFASSVIFVTVLSMSAVAAPAGAAASAGSLIKMNGLSTVYYLGADGKRYVFPNEQTYTSWYKDFSGVVTVPQSELESYPLGANVTIRPGTKLVKITTNPTVYAVEPGGNLRSIVSEANAIALWGANWAKTVVDVPDAFFTNYKTGTALTAGVYPVGTLVKTAASANVYYWDGTNYRQFASEAALNANKFNMANVVTTSLAITAGGSQVTATESALTDTSSGAGGTVGAGSGLTVAIAGNTAPSNTVLINSAAAELATFNFTASNDGDVTVTSLKLKRIGISSDATLDSVYLFDGTKRLTDAASPSSGVINFNLGSGLFIVTRGTTKAITVKADIKGDTSQTAGVSINAATDIITNGASVSGSFPATGNLMSTAQATTGTMGTADIATQVTSVGKNVNAGTAQTILWSAPITIGTKYSNLKYLSLAEVGSVSYDAITNITLFVNGTQAGTATALDANGKAIFDLSASPVKLDTGIQTVEVRGDIIKGSSRNFKFSLQTPADIVLNESGYGVNVIVAHIQPTNGAPSSATDISKGSISVSTDPTFNQTQIVKGTTGATIAKFTMKAYGEDMKVQTLNVIPTLHQTGGMFQNTEGLSNVSLYVNGTQVGSSKNMLQTGGDATTTTANLTTAGLTFGTTNLFTIPAGTTVTLEVRADLTQNSTSYIDTVKADVVALQGAYQGVTSVQTSPDGNTTYTGQAAMTITSGALTMSTTGFTSMNVLANTAKVKIASIVLQAGSAEGVKITNVRIDLPNGSSTAYTDMSNLYISENLTPVLPQQQNNFSVNVSIPANGNKVIDVFCDIGNATTGSSTQATMTVTANGLITNKSVGGSKLGQLITVQSGSLGTPTLVGSAAVAAIVTGGTTAKAAQYKFVATNGQVTISELEFNVVGTATTSPNPTAIGAITVNGVTSPVVYNGTRAYASLTGLNLAIPAGTQGKAIDVNAVYASVTSSGQGGSATRNSVGLNLVRYKYTVGSLTTDQATNVASNVMLLVAGAPVISLASDNPAPISSGYAFGGNNEVMRFTVTVAAGQYVNLRNIGMMASYVGTLSSSTTQLLKIYDKNAPNTSLGQVSIGTSGTQKSLQLNNDYTIDGGTSGNTVEFIIKADLTGLTSGATSFRVDLNATGDTDATTGQNWQWNDGTVSGYGNGYLLKNLDITGSTFSKSA